MKKTIWPTVHKFLKLGSLTFILLICSFSTITNLAVTHAAALRCNPFPFCTDTPTPIPTSIPTPTPIPTNTPNPTQIPQATQTTPTPQTQTQTQTQTRQINVAPPFVPEMTDTPTPATPTTIPTITLTATATTVLSTPTSATTTATDTSHTNQPPQGTGNKGMNTGILFLGIGTPVLLVGGGLCLLMWRRQSKLKQSAMPGAFGNSQGYPVQGLFDNAQAWPWMNNYEMPTNTNIPSTALGPNMSGALPMLGSTQVIPSPQSAYPPSDLRPITAAFPQSAYPSSDLRPITATFPQQMLTMASNNGVSSVQNGGLQSLAMDALGLSLQSNGTGIPNMNGQSPTPLTQSIAEMDTPIPSSSSLLPTWMEGPIPSTPVPLPISLAMQPPSLREDPILQEVMRQTQMGLFVLSGR